MLAQLLKKNKLEQEKLILIYRFSDFRIYLSDSITLGLRQDRRLWWKDKVKARKKRKASKELGTSYSPKGMHVSNDLTPPIRPHLLQFSPPPKKATKL